MRTTSMALTLLSYLEPIVGDDFSKSRRRLFRDASPIRVVEVDVMKTKSFRKTNSPFKVVHESPGDIASNINIIEEISFKGIIIIIN